MYKKILLAALIAGVLLFHGSTSYAARVAPEFWQKVSSYLKPRGGEALGDSTDRISALYVTTLDATTASLGTVSIGVLQGGSSAISQFLIPNGDRTGTTTLETEKTTNSFHITPDGVATSTPAFTITPGSRVGVGSTTPWGLLSVDSPGSTHPLVVGSTTTQFIVSENGNVGIATTSPASLLSVGGNTLIQGDLTIEGNLLGVSSGIGNIVEDTTPQLGGDLDVNAFQIVSVSNGDIVLNPNGSGKIGLGTTTPDALVQIGAIAGTNSLRVGSTTTQLIVDSSGNVGIGSATPNTKFYVTGSKSGNVAYINNSLSTGSGLLIDAGSSASDNAFQIRTYDAGSELLRVTGAGNMGLASTTPWGTLSVQNSGSHPALVVSNSSNLTQFIVAANGNIGVGATNTPSALLSVQGAVRAHGAIESTSGGFTFPDGTTQTSAASGASSVCSTGQTSRVINSTGSQTIAHGLSTTPTYLVIDAKAIAQTGGSMGVSYGTATTASNESVTYLSIGGTAIIAGQSSALIVEIRDNAASVIASAALTGLDSTNITINWGTNQNAGGTRYLQWTTCK